MQTVAEIPQAPYTAIVRALLDASAAVPERPGMARWSRRR